MTIDQEKKTATYKWIRIGGLLSFIPVILAAGPMAGYFLADYLKVKFGFPSYTYAICVVIGFAASARETIRIIKLALKNEKRP